MPGNMSNEVKSITTEEEYDVLVKVSAGSGTRYGYAIHFVRARASQLLSEMLT